MVTLPSAGGKGSEANSLMKAGFLRLEPEWLSASVKDLLPRGQCPLTPSDCEIPDPLSQASLF